MDLIKKYNIALQEIYDHIGFEEDWVVFPIDDSTEYYWIFGDALAKLLEERDDAEFFGNLVFSTSKEDILNNNESNIYSNEILHHRFYGKSIFVGEKYTGILVDTHTDGNKFLQIFENDKQLK